MEHLSLSLNWTQLISAAITVGNLWLTVRLLKLEGKLKDYMGQHFYTSREMDLKCLVCKEDLAEIHRRLEKAEARA